LHPLRLPAVEDRLDDVRSAQRKRSLEKGEKQLLDNAARRSDFGAIERRPRGSSIAV